MILLEILEALDIPVVWRQDKTGLKFFGASPDDHSELAWDEDRVVVYTRWAPREWVKRRAIDSILHEALHGMVGPKSLGDEGAVMAFQWQILFEMNGEEFLQARRMFSMYGLGNGVDVGDSDDFIRLRSWKQMLEEARKLDILVGPDDRPVWGLGAHPGWAALARRGGPDVHEPEANWNLVRK